MQEQVAAISTAIPWKDVQSPDLSPHTGNSDIAQAQTPGANTQGYQPVMALAQNHIHFMGVNGVDPGNAKIFVIHCASFCLDVCLSQVDDPCSVICSLVHATCSSILRYQIP